MGSGKKRKVDIFIATHTAEAYGPQYVLKQYLINQGAAFLYAGCPFDYARIARAEAEVYADGKREEQIAGHRNTAKGVISWLRDAWFVWRCGWKYLGPESVFIGINNLNAAIGIILKWLGRGGYVVYYVIDYTPTRFPEKAINWVYQRLARFAARRANMIWNLSRRMRDVHARFGAREETSIMVPIGIHREERWVAREQDIPRNQLVMVSTLFESKGVQVVIAAMAHLPQARLTIIGTGPYADVLQALARRVGVAGRVEFLGLVDRQTLIQRLAHSRVAFAPYQPDPANYSYYADPAKPKEYLVCGVPVVITRVPWIAEEIARRPMGLAVEYDEKAVAAAAQRLMADDDFWRQCRQQALAFSRDLDWEDIFKRAFDALAADKERILRPA
ncbi:glycosyltransferase [candidate division FCPU426 bacterium]|nr:glycosyltransferase [candidate division FCPU426 bacterium]